MPLERQTCSSKKVHENVTGGASKKNIKKKQEKEVKNLRVARPCIRSVFGSIFLHISICKDDAASMPPAAITLSFPS